MQVPTETRHVLYGALVGGPSSANDSYTDSRADYVMNEVATDYNAGFTSALVRLYNEYGGTRAAELPAAETPDLDELTVETTVMQNEPRATGIKAIIYNKSAFPARALTKSSFRYYFKREGTSAIQVTPGYTQGCPSPSTAKQHSGDIWYVEVNCTGYTIAPAGQSQHRMEVQFKVGVPEGGTWDPSNDPSYQAAAGPNRNVPLYAERGTGLGSRSPDPASSDTIPPTTPGTPAASAITSTGVTLNWAASTDTGGSGLAGYDVYRKAGTTDVLVGPPAAATLAVTGLSPSTTYQFYVVARDGAGNRSAPSATVSVTTASGGGDTTPPTTPGTPTASAIASTGVTLSWAASTDNVGVTGYRVYRRAGTGDVLLATVTGTSYAVTGLTPSTSYQFYVVAFDAAGNASASSASVSVTTLAAPPGSACAVIGYSTNDWDDRVHRDGHRHQHRHDGDQRLDAGLHLPGRGNRSPRPGRRTSPSPARR